MRLQYQLDNGAWMDCGERRTEKFLAMCVENKQRTGGEWKKLSLGEVVSTLAEGKELRNDPNDWYSNCRDAEAVERIMAERKANQKPVEMVKCSCGHTIRRSSVMNASIGSSCPDCYDRMSE